MADKDREHRQEPSLEMPSLGSLFRRRRSESDRRSTTDEPAVEPVMDDRPAESRHDERPVSDEPAVVDGDDDPTTILDEPGGSHEGERTTPVERPLFADEKPAESRERESGGVGLPALPGRVAAAVTGAVIGLLAVGATYLALQGCELARGTSSCGGPGLFLLIAILIGLVFLGGLLLRLWHIGDPMSTSFLAVGLLAVVALLFLIDVIFSPWMALVVPIVAIGTFVLSHWVTTAFVEED